MSFLSIFSAIIALQLLIIGGQAAALDPAEIELLVALREYWPELETNYRWTGDAMNACENAWKGLTCDGNTTFRHLIEIELDLEASSSIPEAIKNASALQKLQLRAPISGPIPALTSADLQKLEITNKGEIRGSEVFPSWTGSLTKLLELKLSGFDFSKEPWNQPTWVFAAPLQTLDLSNSKTNATFPPVLSLPGLQKMYLQGGSYEALSESIGLQLTDLVVSNNNLSRLPSNIGNSVSLSNLDISHNRISFWPTLTDNLTNLISLNASHNFLDMNISLFSHFPELQSLDISSNDCVGNVSQVFSSSSKLANCSIAGNYRLICIPNSSVCCQSSSATTTGTSTTSLSSSSSSSTTTGCAGFQCPCSSNLAGIFGSTCTGGIWTINGTANNTGTVTVGQQDIVIINGSLNQAPQATLEVYVGGQLQVEGSVSLDGALVVFITPSTNGSVLILNATNIQGRFHDVQVQQQYSGKKCHSVKADASYTSTSVSVLIIQTKLGSCSNSNAKTIGIAVGASVGALVILVVLIVIILVLLKKHGKLNVLWWSRPEGTHNRSRLGTVGPQAHSSVHLNRL